MKIVWAVLEKSWTENEINFWLLVVGTCAMIIPPDRHLWPTWSVWWSFFGEPLPMFTKFHVFRMNDRHLGLCPTTANNIVTLPLMQWSVFCLQLATLGVRDSWNVVFTYYYWQTLFNFLENACWQTDCAGVWVFWAYGPWVVQQTLHWFRTGDCSVSFSLILHCTLHWF